MGELTTYRELQKEVELLQRQAIKSKRLEQEVYKQTTIIIKNHLAKRIYDLDLRNEIVSCAVMKIFINFAKYDSKAGAYSTWCTKVAINTYLDHLNSKHNKIRFSEYSDDLLLPQKFKATKWKYSERKKFRAEIKESLPKKLHFKIFYLRYFFDLKLEEISNFMEIPMGTVKATLYRCTDKLNNNEKIRNRRLSSLVR